MAVFLLAGISYILLIKDGKQHYPEIIHSVTDSIDTVPYTSRIYYDVSLINNKNVYLQFGNNRYLLKKDANFQNTRVVEPGFHIYSVYIGDKKVKQFSFLGLTDGWGTLIINQEGKKLYIPKTPEHHGRLYMPNSTITDFVDFQNYRSLQYINGRHFTLQGEKFVFETKFKYKDLLQFENLCQNVVITLLDEKKDFISLHFAVKPCLSNTKIHFGKQSYNGKSSDISFMNINTSEWNTTRIVSKNRQFHLFVNDSLCLKEPYLRTLGNIIMVKVLFLGAVCWIMSDYAIIRGNV